MKELGGCFSLALALTFPFPATSHSRTWHVQNDGLGDALTIQAGIDSAASGDTVLVDPGTYEENITFLGKNILLRSATGPEGTVIDGGLRAASCVSFVNHENSQACLKGFTLVNGTGSPNVPGAAPAFGGGVIILGASPTITNNIISGNVTSSSTTGGGGGIWCAGTSIDSTWAPRIEGNTISGNTTTVIGGGIGVLGNMRPLILNNVITNNSVIEGDGGGIAILGRIDGSTLNGNYIVANESGDHGGGIYFGSGVEQFAPQIEISLNVVARNIAKGQGNTGNSGGGVWITGATAFVFRNTIAFNEGRGLSDDWGGGLVLDQAGSATVTRNIIAFNAGGGIWCGGGVATLILDNLGWMNSGGEGVGTCPTWWQSNGNLIENPYFCDAAGNDFRVASNSIAMTHPAGPWGAFPNPGCGPVTVLRTTWGKIKSSYK
jgi:hypothetical protein